MIEREPADRASLAAASPGLLSSAVILVAVFHVVCGCFSLCVTAPLLPDDLAIYRDAIDRARAGLDPYRPFGIGLSFVYPPPALVLLSPLAVIPRSIAPAVWMLVNLGLYAVTMRLLWVAVQDAGVAAAVSGPANTRSRLLTTPAMLFVVVFLLYAPLLEGLVVGQTDVLVLAGLTLFLTRGRPTPGWIGALGLAAAISIKISPILVLVVAIAGRDWRTVARVAGIVFALSVVAIGLYGWTPWVGFVAVLPSLAAGEPGWANLSTGATVGRFLRKPGVAEAFADGLAALSSLALIGWGLWVIARASKSARLERESFAISLATVASSLVWYHSLTLLVPSIAVLLFQTRRRWRQSGLEVSDVNRAPVRSSWTIIALSGLVLIQTDRVWEVLFGAPPLAATIGSLAVLWSASRRVTAPRIDS